MAYHKKGNPSSGGSPGGGPGTAVGGGVRRTLDAPFGNPGDKGTEKKMAAPFDQGRTGGSNDAMPEEIYSDLGGPSKAPKANRRDSLGTIETDPKSPRR